MLARMQKSMKEKDQGFTLIELLVVIIIIGILAAIAIPVFLNQRKKGVDASLKSDLKNAATASRRGPPTTHDADPRPAPPPAPLTVAAWAAALDGFRRAPATRRGRSRRPATRLLHQVRSTRRLRGHGRHDD